MGIEHGPDAGGTFDSFFDVFFTADFTEVGNPFNTFSLSRGDSLRQSPCTWSHTPPDGILPGSNNFFPGGVPGHPSQLNPVFYQGGQLNLGLVLAPVPEPATLSLLALGGSLAVLWKKRKVR